MSIIMFIVIFCILLIGLTTGRSSTSYDGASKVNEVY